MQRILTVAHPILRNQMFECMFCWTKCEFSMVLNTVKHAIILSLTTIVFIDILLSIHFIRTVLNSFVHLLTLRMNRPQTVFEDYLLSKLFCSATRGRLLTSLLVKRNKSQASTNRLAHCPQPYFNSILPFILLVKNGNSFGVGKNAWMYWLVFFHTYFPEKNQFRKSSFCELKRCFYWKFVKKRKSWNFAQFSKTIFLGGELFFFGI